MGVSFSRRESRNREAVDAVGEHGELNAVSVGANPEIVRRVKFIDLVEGRAEFQSARIQKS